MAIEYRYLDRGPDEMIRVSELPTEGGLAVSLRTTGYELGEDEIVQLAIVDLAGNEVFSQVVKPQNKETWKPGPASGGIAPADVQDSPELYQFEDELHGLFEKATVVVGEHLGFIAEMIEASWVALPPFERCDIADEFCASHSTADYPDEPAAVASLSGIAGYYGLPVPADDAPPLDTARAVAASYRALVDEHARERAGKPADYWERYEREREEARLNDADLQRRERMQAIRTARINAILWLCAAAIFSNLAVQLHVRGMDFGIVAIIAAAAVFFAVRWALSLYTMYKLSRENTSG